MSRTKRFGMAFILLFISELSVGGATVLVVDSYHAQFPWVMSYREGLEEVLAGRYTLQYFEMDTKRLPRSQYQERADRAWEVYLQTKPALVILADDNALEYLGPEFSDVDTPVVYMGINRNPRDYVSYGAKNITGVLERPLMKRSIASIKALLPETQNVLVLFDSGPTSQSLLTEMFEGQRRHRIHGVNVDIRSIDDWDTWQKTILMSSPHYDALVVGLYQAIVDGNNIHIPAETVINWTSQHTPIPPFGFWDFSVGEKKCIGGLVLYGKEQGKAAGTMALKILKGTSPRKLSPRTAPHGHYLYSEKQLNKYAIHLPRKIALKAELIE
ncbi:ABC transporter substrate-binding protein [Teredinibacter sp. KSP-S5-2]|uniref:ABC transporter substrate-binding protein n=1 Tax=Teredinibacter sp. KSP-S5-2 TaxID=3034506 RepID=UPI0029350D63|nr:ABC transporter substrate binding protein [Teredinibacter sp. KSP-S5-2]WNO09012.1 ABC transporter substrate binding protein [Teredinibacter sp. KSP-S5-2]